MTWFIVDDRWHSHRKVIGLSLAARGLWATLGSWCASELNGGFIPQSVSRHFGGTSRTESALVQAGLWIRVEGGYQFHDWHDYQPSKAQILAKRAATRDRVSRHRSGNGNGVTSGVTNGVTNSVANASPILPNPLPLTERELSPLLAADASAPTREDFGGGKVLRAALPSQPSLAARGAEWLSRATEQEPYSHSGKWAAALAHIASKPELERNIAGRVIAAEARKPGVLAILNPQHIADHWHLYSAGKAPGQRRQRFAGPSRVPTAAEHARDAEEIAPWDR